MKKIVFVFIITILFHQLLFGQNVLDKEIVLTKEYYNLSDLINTISQQSGIVFSYSNANIDNKKNIKLQAKEYSIEQVLNIIVKQTGLQYYYTSNKILLSPPTNNSKNHKVIISGIIKDSSSGETIIGAYITDLINKNTVSTNQYGFYSLSTMSDSVKLLFSYLGYKNESVIFKAQKDTVINMNIASVISLQEVEVDADENKLMESAQTGELSLSPQQIKTIPTVVSQPDVIKAYQMMPGIQSGMEGTSTMLVRGGNPDENLFLLDGTPVYNISHLFGFFSVFNPDAIKNVDVFKSGFPARYSGRLSSVMDISLKEGNENEFHGNFSIGLLASSFMIEGPIKKKKCSFILAARRTYPDLILGPIVKLALNNEQSTVNKFKLYYYDVNAKINYNINSKNRLFLSLYGGRDVFEFVDTENDPYVTTSEQSSLVKNSWGNITGTLRWNHIYSSKLFSNINISYTSFKYITNNQYDYTYSSSNYSSSTNYSSDYNSGINDISSRIIFSYAPSVKHYLQFGIYETYRFINIGNMNNSSSFVDTASSIHEEYNVSYPIYHCNEASVFIEDEWTISKKLKSNIGLNCTSFNATQVFYLSVEPRISARYLLFEKTALKASYSYMSQNLHLLSTLNAATPDDLWVTSTQNIKPEHSNNFAFGINQLLLHSSIQFSAEGYYKTLSNVLSYQESFSIMANEHSNWEENVIQGKGETYGTDIMLQKTNGKTTGWIGYTLSWNYRQFNELNNGEEFPYKYDRRHDIKICLMHKINNKIDIGFNWLFTTGMAVTIPVSFYLSAANFNYSQSTPTFVNSSNEEQLQYSKENDFRMPPYHRLDFSINFHKKKKFGERIWNITIYNVYCRINPISLDENFIKINDAFNYYTFYTSGLFPIIPSFSYSLKF